MFHFTYTIYLETTKICMLSSKRIFLIQSSRKRRGFDPERKVICSKWASIILYLRKHGWCYRSNLICLLKTTNWLPKKATQCRNKHFTLNLVSLESIFFSIVKPNIYKHRTCENTALHIFYFFKVVYFFIKVISHFRLIYFHSHFKIILFFI